jgi:hypothetical protein
MATERRVIQCTVCRTKVAIRTLIGFLDGHPITLECPRCNVDISGTAKIDQENVGFGLSFQNAVSMGNKHSNKADYYANVSSELLTEKLQKLADGKVPPFHPTIFTVMDGMGEDNYLLYKGRILSFIGNSKKVWPTLKKINELWVNNQHKYCAAEIRKLLPKDRYPLTNDLGILTAVKHLNVTFVAGVLPDSFLDRDAKAINSRILDLVRTDGKQLLDLSRRLASAQKFKRYRELFVARLEHFIQTFPHLIPVFSAPYYGAKEEEVLATKGIFTADIRTISQFYIDSYENIIEMADGVVALNNLIHRSQFMTMRALRKDVKTLDDYDRLQKGDKLKFLINPDEDFGDMLGSCLDNRIRNSIGHSGTRFDPITQRLDFYSGVGQPKPAVSKFLTQFANDCRLTLLILFRIMELNSWLERIYLMGAGQKPARPKGWK